MNSQSKCTALQNQMAKQNLTYDSFATLIYEKTGKTMSATQVEKICKKDAPTSEEFATLATALGIRAAHHTA